MPHEQRFLYTETSVLSVWDHKLTVMRLYFCLILPLLRTGGKDKTMKRIPKTPVEFDYDLWTTEDGKCMVRVKLTGEVMEVDRDVMKLLRAEEKKLRRSFTGSPSDEKEDAEQSVLSLDSLPDDDVKAAAWLADPHDLLNEVTMKLLEAELRKSLTERQLDVYEKCLLGGRTFREYARKNNIDVRAVFDAKAAVQKKFEKVFMGHSTNG